MNDPWKLYDDLIEGIPDGPTVKDYDGGQHWARVLSSENNMGVAMNFPIVTMPCLSQDESLIGKPLRKVAALVKSWNLVEAAIGHAAINSWYNELERTKKCGFEHPSINDGAIDAFDVYFREIQGKNVTVVGHFPYIESRFAGRCELSILERNPALGDYPDSACEYILGEQDYVFITGSTFVNKTLPRLLELSQNAKVVIVGPSTTLSPILFEHGVYGLSGFISTDNDRLENILRGANNHALFDAGLKMDQIRR